LSTDPLGEELTSVQEFRNKTFPIDAKQPGAGIKILHEFTPVMSAPSLWTGASLSRNPCCGIPDFAIFILFSPMDSVKIKNYYF